MNGLLRRWMIGVLGVALVSPALAQIRKLPFFRRGSELVTYQVVMDDAGGLVPKAPVLLNGVRVGSVRSLGVVDEGAVATLEVDAKIPIRQGAMAKVASLGFVGEKQVELTQGKKDAPPLPPGSVIPVEPGKRPPEEVFDLGAEIGQDLKDVTRTLRSSLGGKENRERFDAMIGDLAGLTRELRALVAANGEAVSESARSIRELSRVLEALALRSGPGVERTVEETQALLASLRRSAESLERITQRVERGEGTLGALLADGKSAGIGGSGVGTLAEVGAAVAETRLGASMLAETYPERGGTKFYLLGDVTFRSKWLLRGGIVSQPFGIRSVRVTETTTTLSTGQTTTALTREEATRTGFAYSVMAGVIFAPLVFRGGIFESTPGIGSDLFLFDNRLRLTAEAWDLSARDTSVHLKAMVGVAPVRWLEIVGGWDDFLNQDRAWEGVFLGAGLRW